MGPYGTIPGGRSIECAGYFSFAAGYRAKARHTGSFVWGDLTEADATSWAPNQFQVRANGGAVFSTGGSGLKVDGSAVLTESKLPR